MSVNIRWRPVVDKGVSFRTGTSVDLEMLKRMFPSKKISYYSLEAVRMVAKATESAFFEEVAEVLETQGDGIEFWGVW
jgi:hypothetical protein